jgi:hypothetical protein
MRSFAIFFAICVVLSHIHGHAFEHSKTLVVVGVQNESGSDEWDEHLLALGVTNLISEELFRTGQYIPIENNPEIVKAVNDIVAFNQQSNTTIVNTDRSAQIHQLESDTIAYGIIKRFKKRRKRAIAGPCSFSKVTASLEIEIVLKGKDGSVRSAVGKGKGVTLSKGLFVQIREKEIRFDQTGLATVAGDAVKQAVMQLHPNGRAIQ